jgi:hypothetical protein
MQSTGLIHLEILLFDKKDKCKKSGCKMSVCLIMASYVTEHKKFN